MIMIKTKQNIARLILFICTTLAFGYCGDKKAFEQTQHFETGQAKPNSFWWPNQVDLSPLKDQQARSNPYGEFYNYAREFSKVDLKQLKSDIKKVMTDSQDWWPADWGTYGGLFIRLAWHSAGTYRVDDGRGGSDGGQIRLMPLNSWPDNANLDKARRLLWPVKKKYGPKVSWADIFVLSGNVALETMGFKTHGFAGGRVDQWEPDLVYWGPEKVMLANNRKDKDGKLQKPLGASHMGLIYVNPEGPDGKPDPIAAAQAIRTTFGRMAMNDEETAALIVGGHTLGKAHGAHRAQDCVGEDPSAAPIEDQGTGWKSKCGKGHSEDTVTSGIEGAWTSTPTKWNALFLAFLYGFNWEVHKGPGGAWQWRPTDEKAQEIIPDAHIKGKMNPPMMLTTDIALKEDPEYKKITSRWLKNPQELDQAFAKAWFKLTHRDLGPRARYLGEEFPKEIMIWQDHVEKNRYAKLNAGQLNDLRSRILKSKLGISELIKTAWAAAASYRASDMRGGTNGARLALAPQNNWVVNEPNVTGKVVDKLKTIKKEFTNNSQGITLANLIVFAGNVAVEEAARKAGQPIKVPFSQWRGDATQKMTDVHSFNHLELKADGFRNYFTKDSYMAPIKAMIDKADLLDLTVPEMTVLVGGLRVLGANHGDSKHGVFTDKVGALSNDFFVNLYDMKYRWEKASGQEGVYNGVDRKTGKVVFTGTPVDLVFSSSSELRIIGEVYAANDGSRKLVKDFAMAWAKVMNHGRF